MDEANGESGAAAPVPEGGGELPARRVPGQRDPVARPETAHPPARPSVPAPASAPADDDFQPVPHPGYQSELSDAELVDLVRGGRDSAYEELYRRHADSVRRYARSCCRDAHTAEDLTGEVFARTLQAIRGGSGPQSAVRAYLLTTVRRVAAAWGTTAKREQLVEDFAVFAVSTAGSPAAETAEDLGADVRAMHEAERSLAIRAFRTLPERWQTVLWHTAVEDESPTAIAALLGLTPNATAVLAHRAREGLRQAYLQAHVSASLTAEGECARYADRLGAHTRGALRLRADRDLNRHLKECARCSAASMELADLNSALKGLLPVAYIGWFAAAGAAKAAGIIAGGTAAAGGAAAAAAGSGSSAGSAGGAAAAEGLGAPAKAGVVAGVVVAAAATALAFALTGGDAKPKPAAPRARPSASAPVATLPAPPQPSPRPTPRPTPPPAVPVAAPPAPKPTPRPHPAPTTPTPSPTPTPTPPPATPPPTTPPPPTLYKVNSLPVGWPGAQPTGPAIRPSSHGWWWDRWELSIGGTTYDHGITVHAPSTVTIDLNRSCVSYDARAGVDDLVRLVRTTVDFSVYGDGTQLWDSGPVRAGDPAAPAHVGIKGYTTLQLVVRPGRHGLGAADLADWADSVITCA